MTRPPLLGAKALDTTPEGDPSQSPTLTAAATQMGVIMGTAAYMSPEQARGKPVDKRADIWAFGCVVYEMLTGRRLFHAADGSEMRASILVKDPDLSGVSRQAPPQVIRVLRRCLAKDPKRRIRDIGDVRLLLDESETPAVETRVGAAPARAGWVWPAMAAAGVAAAVAVSAYHLLQPQPPPPAPVTFEVRERGRVGLLSALSPDGRHLVFTGTATQQSEVELKLRSLSGLESRAVPVTGSVQSATNTVAWSPDSRSLAFATFGGRLYRTDVESGLSAEIVGVVGDNALVFAVAWGPEGTILYGAFSQDPIDNGIWSVSAVGGEPRQLVEGRFLGPMAFLPGRRFLYGAFAIDGSGGITVGAGVDVRVGSLDVVPEDQDPTVLLQTESTVAYVPAAAQSESNLLVFVRRGRLVAQPFDAATVRLVGSPTQIADGVGAFSTATAGALSFVPGSAGVGTPSRLVVFDRAGQQLEVVGPPANYGVLNLLADGRRLAVDRTDLGQPQRIQILDLARGAFRPLSPGSNGDYASAPSPDGEVAYTLSPGTAPADIYARAASGVGEPRRLVLSATVKHANDWSPDGRWLIFDDHRSGMAQDLFVVSRDGGDPIPFQTTEADETLAQFSPDGRWIAYMSDESGRPEIYVRDFAPDRVPAHGSEWVLITVDGGNKPRWSVDGREIFFLAPDGTLMAAPVSPGVPFEVGTPMRLFQTSFRGYVPYDVMPDGNFITNTLADPRGGDVTPIVVMLNWQSLLRR